MDSTLNIRIISEHINSRISWEIDKTKIVRRLNTITFTSNNNKIYVDCHKYLLSTQIMKKYLDLGYSKDIIINQICEWMHQRINMICNDIVTKNSNCVIFEVIYRWENLNIMSFNY